jgi:hypothetical protein
MTLTDADQVIACSPCGPTISFNEWMNPIQPPQCVGRENSRMTHDIPVLMNDGNELIDQFRDIHKVRRYVIADVYWLFAKASPKLGNIGHRHAIQRPQCILVECLNALTKAYFDAIRKQVILPKQILLLHTSEQLRVFGLSDGHRNATPTFDRKLRL